MTLPSNDQPRRRIQELRTLYTLKPHFRDVVVEGRDDAALLNWFMAEHGIPHVKAFAVDDRVEIPRDVVEPVHPEINVRGRVVALAHEAEQWGLAEPSITCVIDSDFDLLDGVERPEGILLATDYAAMEVYALETRPLSKFLLAVAKSELDVLELRSLLKPVWAVVFALRYVLHRHANGAALVDGFANACIDGAGDVVADASSLMRHVAPTPNAKRIQELLELHAEYIGRIPEADLQGIRGHDIAPVLVSFLRLRNDLAQPKQVERLLRQSLELRDLDEQPLFQRLLARLSAAE
jgi:hypothetical protein